jgi:hypothetical protein
MTVMSLFASHLWKTCVAPDCVYQIAVNPKLLLKFGEWCKFSSYIKEKSHKMKLWKMRPTCIVILIKAYQDASVKKKFEGRWGFWHRASVVNFCTQLTCSTAFLKLISHLVCMFFSCYTVYGTSFIVKCP